jgi:hypothetical protein
MATLHSLPTGIHLAFQVLYKMTDFLRNPAQHFRATVLTRNKIQKEHISLAKL